MKRLITLGLASALALSIGAACRTQHLGPNTGDKYRAAFEQQREAEPGENDVEFTADDARSVLRAHHATDGKPGASVSSGTAPGPAPSLGSGASMSTGKFEGAQGNISLEAK